jgi:prepilin-type N-terminal cleavage/methylation domain-containing protein
MNRPGVTLIELLVTLVILAIVTSVVTPALNSSRVQIRQRPVDLLSDSLAVAIARCRDVVITYRTDTRTAYASARCDGSIVADTAYHIEVAPTNGANTR